MRRVATRTVKDPEGNYWKISLAPPGDPVDGAVRRPANLTIEM
jgi:hypothetical protein